MSHHRAVRFRAVVLLLAAGSIWPSAAAFAADPSHPLQLGEEAVEYAVASRARPGSFLVAWVGPGDGTGSPRQVWARRFGPRGFPASEAAVLGEAPPEGEPAFLSVAPATSIGHYFVVWNRIVQGVPQAVTRRVAWQPAPRLEVLGDGVVQAAVAPLVDRRWVSVTMEPDGELWATLRSPVGEPTERILVSRQASFFDLESDASGNFVILWRSFAGGAVQGLRAVRFDADGRWLRSVAVAGDQNASPPALAMSPDGGWLAAWTADGTIRYRRYRPSGRPLGGVRSLPVAATSVAPALMQTGEGLLTWYDFDAAGSPVLGQRLDRRGDLLGATFEIDPQGRAPVATGRGRRGFVAVWSNAPADLSLRGRLVPPSGEPAAADH